MTDLFSPHRDAVVRSLERRFGRELAEDAVQDALACALVSGEEPANPKAWLHVVAHRRAVDVLRAQREAPHAEPPEVGVACDPADELVLRERVRSVLGALRTIPRRQRDALLLRSLEDRSYAEIGAQLDVEAENAKQLVSRGRRSLRARVGALVPAPLFARAAEFFQRGFEVATGTAAGRACAGLCVAGAFASLSVEAPVVRELAAAPAATPAVTATPAPTVVKERPKTPKRRVAPKPTPAATPVAAATTAATPSATPPPVATPIPTPPPSLQEKLRVPTSDRETEALAERAKLRHCPRTQAALQRCGAQFRERLRESRQRER
ncbi:sigma-70 family RNA polymerase sigma factor [Solirubrobacter taibaiensis]|nr:sigma-70 family RNA polymerase sigma factor [Solirubrobacter taibaiensis]